MEMKVVEVQCDREENGWVMQTIANAMGQDFLVGQYDESEVRIIVKWIKDKHPEILRDIMCEDCPEVC